MNQEQKFWLGLWSIVGIVLMTIAVCTTIGVWHSTNKYAEVLKATDNPMAAACAWYGSARH